MACVLYELEETEPLLMRDYARIQVRLVAPADDINFTALIGYEPAQSLVYGH